MGLVPSTRKLSAGINGLCTVVTRTSQLPGNHHGSDHGPGPTGLQGIEQTSLDLKDVPRKAAVSGGAAGVGLPQRFHSARDDPLRGRVNCYPCDEQLGHPTSSAHGQPRKQRFQQHRGDCGEVR